MRNQIVKSLESRALRKRPVSIRIADALTGKFGSMAFLGFNLVLFASWIYINSGRVAQITPFDPFPFTLLTMIVSLEAIVLSIIVLMSQNRQSYISTLREEVDMQVNLISEREITKVLKLLKELKEALLKEKKIDQELEEMIKEVDASYIERKLEEELAERPEPIIKKVEEAVEKTLTPKE
ncbi:hypothetical protein A2V61_04250 [Candidatus Woesebacteria bacterium RBG_19FT_COMBO_47_8]|uniref:DUF1003 domain-containing protein n=1 Tax=Candidatus Woesebacteria bacterium RBG_13_46_13 TaxID=1802479 RepID=A0A1F7X344_9BACT|nr:MAG: hypothetical protein A2Y68_01160 [Candidatus Woesebacteria bacterium RBG_13_46_13]OGM17012.1 MAG: hypothetical protein A2V61_04250 [Candidatus Woesebacteria bacterium RBG_19FT_COMBO_47_8]